MNLYLIEQRDDDPDFEYDTVIALVGAAKNRKEAEVILLPQVFHGEKITFIGKAKPGTKNGAVILSNSING